MFKYYSCLCRETDFLVAADARADHHTVRPTSAAITTTPMAAATSAYPDDPSSTKVTSAACKAPIVTSTDKNPLQAGFDSGSLLSNN